MTPGWTGDATERECRHEVAALARGRREEPHGQRVEPNREDPHRNPKQQRHSGEIGIEAAALCP